PPTLIRPTSFEQTSWFVRRAAQKDVGFVRRSVEGRVPASGVRPPLLQARSASPARDRRTLAVGSELARQRFWLRNLPLRSTRLAPQRKNNRPDHPRIADRVTPDRLRNSHRPLIHSKESPMTLCAFLMAERGSE